jgi:hypothetical protein
MLHIKLPRNLRSRSLSLALLLEFSFYFGYQEYWTEESVLDCGEPWYHHYFPEEGAYASGSAEPTTVGVLGKAHPTLAAVNNLQAEHQSTMLETSTTFIGQTLSIR